MGATTESVRAELTDLAGRSAYGADFGEIVSGAVGSLLPFDGSLRMLLHVCCTPATTVG